MDSIDKLDSINQLDVDEEIYNCLNLEKPKSFFLFAGAGSGKTRTLVNVLQRFRSEKGDKIRQNGQQIAIITYTNAACDEIKRRLEFDSIFAISTIHSFAWELIKSYQSDIREWMRYNLNTEIKELEIKQKTGRVGTKAFASRAEQISSKNERLRNIESIKSFSYNPNGLNIGRESLNHAEVIKIAAEFLSSRHLMQKILIRKFPILLIDESQDTKKELIESFFSLQNEYKDQFSLGLLGDMMQRIYTDGKIGLEKDLPGDWAKPEKIINYRCPKRVILLINKIRSDVDEHTQNPSDKNSEGIVRLFLVDTNKNVDKYSTEGKIINLMSEITGDSLWSSENGVKILTLEHHMAAKRGGFLDFFEPLYKVEKLSTGLLEGTLTGVSFFINQLIPLIQAKRQDNEFKVTQILRNFSPLLSKNTLKNSKNPLDEIKKADSAVNALMNLWNNGKEPTLLDLLCMIAEFQLFLIPDTFRSIIANKFKEVEDSEVDGLDIDLENEAWNKALTSSFNQLEAYADYISDNSRFGTHHGVKGLEFPRVMVILDDEDARGFLFSYEKLLGAKPPSDADNKNLSDNKETSIDRTRRLFYVTCSRARESLAIVAYTKDQLSVKNFALQNGWFNNNEVICL